MATYFWQAIDKFVSMHFLARLKHHLSLLSFGFICPFGSYETIRNILKNGITEKKGFLLNNADLGPPPMKIDIFQIVSADHNGPRTCRPVG